METWIIVFLNSWEWVCGAKKRQQHSQQRDEIKRGTSLRERNRKRERMKVHGLFLVAILSLALKQLVKGQSWPGCSPRCGNIEIEYPFGISTSCYYPGDESFNLFCNSDNKLFFGDFEVVSISHSGELRIMVPISYACFDSLGNRANNLYYNFELSSFTLSENNSFTGVGCDTSVVLTNYGVRSHSTGCITVCDSVPVKGSCSGEGCCQSSIPKGGKRFQVQPFSYNNHTSVHQFNPCSYAFLVEKDKFNLSVSEDLWNLRNVKSFPVVLDWSIGNQTCEQVGNTSICSENSECSNSITRTGYICRCNKGFQGNPYLSDGCQDINECTSTTIHKHNCSDSKTCENTMGDFTCKCPSGYDLNTTNMSCVFNAPPRDTPKQVPKYVEWTTVLLGTTIGFLLILLCVSCIQQRMKHRKDTELRQQFFEQNGGGMLIQRLSGAGPSNVDVKIFTEEGMKEATNGYDESRILGEGGQGTVYKGILPDNSIVAIKKARLGDCSQVEQFINEVLVLSQINHRNVVKILGCCLETEVPLLVYEFITNGTLFDHLHGSLFDYPLTWEHRLRIATEIAGTLAYLHSSASIPIIHRDIKTANILLDDNLTAKVADFGASRLIPMDKEQLTTMVQGTLGYLDPEYYNTGLLNEKSDVYSFGVVLMELLSGQKAMCFERPQHSKHLVSYFASATKENKLEEIIDGQLMRAANHQEIQEVARVAVWCTRVTGEERPRMKEVAAELDGLRVITSKHGKLDQYPEPKEIEHLPGGHMLSAPGNTSGSGYDSVKNTAIMDIEAGR